MTGSDLTANPPMNEAELALAPSIKLVIGDWIWHKDRSVLVMKNQWHNYTSERRIVWVFGDGHAEFFQFPQGYDTWPGTRAYSITNGFW